jgi:hypothetical protein
MRRLLRILAVASLVLCVADIALVVGSFFFRVGFSVDHRDSTTVAAPSWVLGCSAMHGILDFQQASYVSFPAGTDGKEAPGYHIARWNWANYELRFALMPRAWGWRWK